MRAFVVLLIRPRIIQILQAIDPIRKKSILQYSKNVLLGVQQDSNGVYPISHSNLFNAA